MEKGLVNLVLLLCVSGSLAVWNVKNLPHFLENVVQNEKPANFLENIMQNEKPANFLENVMQNEKATNFLKNLFNSNQVEYIKENSDEGRDQLLKNILRFGTVEIYSSRVGDQGHATNCGLPSRNFSLTWEPKEPSISSSIKINFNMVAPEDIAKGTLDITAYMGGTPILEQKVDFCEYAPKIGIKCPLKKGQKISVSKVISNISMLPATTYMVVAKIIADKGDVFACAKLTITITE